MSLSPHVLICRQHSLSAKARDARLMSDPPEFEFKLSHVFMCKLGKFPQTLSCQCPHLQNEGKNNDLPVLVLGSNKINAKCLALTGCSRNVILLPFVECFKK